MRILQVNKFFYIKGGAERCVQNTAKYLGRQGHQVAFFAMHHRENPEYQGARFFTSCVDYNAPLSFRQKALLFLRTLYSVEARKNMEALVQEFKPDIAHLHNYHHQLTPSILKPLRDLKIPVVCTLHDYKLICPSYSMLHHGRICEECRNGHFYHCFLKRCHKDSAGKSFLATMESYLHHVFLRSYRGIQTYISPSRFLVEKSRQMGLRGKFVHLPNFVDLEEQTSSISVNERRIVYSGRLSAEKGLECLLRAIKGLECELYIAGDGPMRKALDALVADLDLCNVRFVGHLSSDKLFDLISSAGIVVVPSDWYENNPYSIIEAFAQAKPVVASRIGGIPELVRDGETGLTFTAGNENDLRIKLRLLLEDPRRAKMMGLKAHEFIVSECNPEQHMKKLVEIYKAAIAISQS